LTGKKKKSQDAAEARARAHLSKRLAKAVGNYIRIDILRILNEREASPKEIAAALDEGLSHVSYHVNQLRDYECIEQVRTEPRRGAVEHFYRAVTPPFVSDEQAAEMSKPAREEISAVMLQTVIGEALAALQAGTFDSRTDRHMSWVPMMLGEEGWREMVSLFAEMLEKVGEIKATDAERRADSGENGVEVIVSMMGFERSKSRAAGRALANDE
jgi:DNA-binding transcriptional ArsR family regulator